MGKKATKDTDKKTPAITDLPATSKHEGDVKGGGSLITSTTKGTHIPDGQISV
jgi:hypothetical protein